jgi:hypothetical protein
MVNELSLNNRRHGCTSERVQTAFVTEPNGIERVRAVQVQRSARRPNRTKVQVRGSGKRPLNRTEPNLGISMRESGTVSFSWARCRNERALFKQSAILPASEFELRCFVVYGDRRRIEVDRAYITMQGTHLHQSRRFPTPGVLVHQSDVWPK